MADVTLIFEEQPISLALTTATPINLVLDGGATYTAGTGISITGAVITNTAPDQTVIMTDGTGIDVTGTYPNFTVTNTSPNIVQTLSIVGQDLTLSGGGGTVEIPAGSSLGTGFTAGGGTGTIPAGTVAENGANALVFTTANSRNLSSAIGTKRDANNYFVTGIYEDVDGQFASLFSGKEGDISTEYLVDYNGVSVSASADNNATNVTLGVGGFGILISNTYNGLGATYASDYSATIAANPRSIPDVGTVDLLKQTPVSYDNASAPNNCIFYSTTLSKLAYKDPGGTVNPLY